MHPLLGYIKMELDLGHCDAKFYNEHVVGAVESGLLKDVTPSVYVMDRSRYQVVGAIVEFPDGAQYEIRIFNPPDPQNPEFRYNYQTEVRKVARIFGGG